MKVIGITGPTGAGKTTALQALEALGVLVLDCDAVYHRLLETDRDLLTALEQRFPAAFRQGRLDRKALGALVWQDRVALADLNAITHGPILRELRRQIGEAEAAGRPGAAIDAVALIESGAGELCDRTVAVLAPRETRIRRIMAREGIDRDYAAARVQAQKPEDWFRERCDDALENDSDPETFREKCRALFEKVIREE